MAELISFLNTLSESIHWWMAGLFARVMGGAWGFLIYRLYQTSLKRSAQAEAAEILQDAKDASDLQLLEEKERIQEIEVELWSKDEKAMLETEERIEELEELVQEKKQKSDNRYSQERQKTVLHETEVKEGEKKTLEMDVEVQKIRQEIQKMSMELAEKLATRLQTTPQESQDELMAEMIQESEKRSYDRAKEFEENVKEHSEQLAKELLGNALDRFNRAYCPERGIAPVYFENADQRRILVDEKRENLKTLTEITGCDIIVEDQMEMVGVAGFDPVRRELTRRTLERCLKEKKPLNPDSIRKIAENQKRENSWPDQARWRPDRQRIETRWSSS